MLVIRLFRVGKKNQPSFKIVVIDKRRSSTRGRSVEQVGFYNPLTKEKILNAERIKYWLSVGAKPSLTIHNLFVSEKLLDAKKIDVHKKPKKEGGVEIAPKTETKQPEAGEAEKAPEAK